MMDTMTDAELSERLKEIAVKIFPSANQWAVADGVKNIIAIMETVTPAEYAALRSSLLPASTGDDLGWATYCAAKAEGRQ